MEKKIHFIYNRYKFIENEKKNEEGTLLNRSDDSLDPYDYHLENCGDDVFKTIEANRIHSSWPGMECGFMEELVEDEEDVEEVVDIQELEYTDGSNEVKIFNQKCV